MFPSTQFDPLLQVFFHHVFPSDGMGTPFTNVYGDGMTAMPFEFAVHNQPSSIVVELWYSKAC
jgi:hypothetical protein